jgi:hypothetical protein
MDTLTGMAWNKRPSRMLMITGIAELVLALGFAVAGFLLPGAAVPMLLIAGVLAAVGIPLVWIGAKAKTRHQAAEGLEATGQSAVGQIIGLRQTGWSMNDQPQVEVTMDVQVEGRAPYRVTRKEFVPLMLLGTLTNGAPLPLKVNPQDPKDLVVDWEHAGGGIPFGAVPGGVPSVVVGGFPIGAPTGGAPVIGGTNLPTEEALEANRAVAAGRARRAGEDRRSHGYRRPARRQPSLPDDDHRDEGRREPLHAELPRGRPLGPRRAVYRGEYRSGEGRPGRPERHPDRVGRALIARRPGALHSSSKVGRDPARRD